MVRRDPRRQRLAELVEAERLQVLVRHPRRPHLGELADALLLVGGGEPDAALHHPLDAAVASGATEHEVDRRQQAGVGEDLDHFLAPRREQAVPSPAGPVAGPSGGIGASGLGRPALHRHQLRIRHRRPALVHVHRVDLVPHEVVMLEGYRPLLLDHHPGGPAKRADPLPELLGVAHGRRQADHRDGEREVDQDLLPHGAAIRVLEVVHLVHHDVGEALEGVAPLVEHVAQDLRGHDHHRGFGVDRVVAGEEAHAARPVPSHEVAELLIRQRLQRRRVEGLGALLQRALYGVLGDDRLPGAGRRRDQHGLTPVEGLDGLALELVERERVVGLESFEIDHDVQSTGAGRPLSGRGAVPAGRSGPDGPRAGD